MFLVIEILLDLLAMLFSILAKIFSAKDIDATNPSCNENYIFMIEYTNVLMIEYPKVLMIEYYKTDGVDECHDNNSKVEETQEQTTNDCFTSLAFEEDKSISENNIIETSIIIGNRPANPSMPSKSIIYHRKELDEYERFLLQISYSLF